MSFLTFRKSWDVVFCVDGTASMESSWGTIKRYITELHAHLQVFNVREGHTYKFVLRIKVIVFRDYAFDKVPMEESEFFDMPEDMDALNAFLDRQEIAGGGDYPENGLEALYLAMKSDFIVPEPFKRCFNTVVLITDADAHPPRERADLPSYPKDMVDEATLKDMWKNSDDYPELKLAHIKRLEVFAPHSSIYRRMAEDMFPACFTPLDDNKGAAELSDMSPEEFAETIIYDTFYRMD